MNKFLATALAYFNAVLAFIFIAAGALFGINASTMAMRGYEWTGLLLGLLGGMVAAVLICGLLALLIDIRDELVVIRDQLSRSRRI